MKSLSDYSAWAVHELLTHLPRLAGVTARSCRFLWTWELQKRGALHWHCVLECPTPEGAVKVLEGWRPLWIRIIESIGRKSGVDMAARKDGGTWAGKYEKWQIDGDYARKRPDRYLAKYLSKSNGKGEAYFPTRWYGINRALHKELRDATSHFKTHENNKTQHVISESDLGIIEKITKEAYLVRHFPDKVAHGYTFVCYLEDEKMDEAKRIFGEIERTMELKDSVASPMNEVGCFTALWEVNKRPYLKERYLNDLGSYYRGLFFRWMDEDGSVPDSELYWLEYYARRLLFITGLNYKGQPPERSGAGLPGRDDPKIECNPTPIPDPEQTALFP